MILERVLFKAKAGTSEQQMQLAREQSDQFLIQQPGFERRELNYNDELGCWVDQVYWHDLPCAQAAADKFPKAEVCQPFQALIQQVIEFKHSAI